MYVKATNMYDGEENLPHIRKRSNYRQKGGPRCEKHLFWDADYDCSEYRGRNIDFAESQPSRLMTWTNNTMMMRKYPTGKWMMTGCGRWIFYFGTAMKMNIHSERERGRYAEEEIR